MPMIQFLEEMAAIFSSVKTATTLSKEDSAAIFWLEMPAAI
jgi:hypothetical protein